MENNNSVNKVKEVSKIKSRNEECKVIAQKDIECVKDNNETDCNKNKQVNNFDDNFSGLEEIKHFFGESDVQKYVDEIFMEFI